MSPDLRKGTTPDIAAESSIGPPYSLSLGAIELAYKTEDVTINIAQSVANDISYSGI